MKIVSINLFIQVLQIILPLYIISFILNTSDNILRKVYTKNIKKIDINENITIYNYNKNNDSIFIINGGGLVFNDVTDIIIIYNILPKLNNYNYIVINYNLFNKLSETIEEVKKNFEILLTYNLKIKVFIGNSIGCLILFELFKKFTQFKKEKLILISPVVNINVKCNKNMKKDILNYTLYNYVKNKYYDINIIINYDVLPNMFIICSSNEIFYYDIINFYNKSKNSKLYCIKDGIHSEYIVYGFMNNFKYQKITNEIINFIETT
jgi:hypothetical protein